MYHATPTLPIKFDVSSGSYMAEDETHNTGPVNVTLASLFPEDGHEPMLILQRHDV